MAVAGPLYLLLDAAAHVLKCKLPTFHELKFFPALLSLPTGRYGSRTNLLSKQVKTHQAAVSSKEAAGAN